MPETAEHWTFVIQSNTHDSCWIAWMTVTSWHNGNFLVLIPPASVSHCLVSAMTSERTGAVSSVCENNASKICMCGIWLLFSSFRADNIRKSKHHGVHRESFRTCSTSSQGSLSLYQMLTRCSGSVRQSTCPAHHHHPPGPARHDFLHSAYHGASSATHKHASHPQTQLQNYHPPPRCLRMELQNKFKRSSSPPSVIACL
ncbi:hypothetical protein HDK90DRAFT_337780 [Phyllosticta capitalensis]|uniref:Uncharacterized protein n=1 Tax=Phyllosticta capitalensis TaxID=121624 RepID=A0ABR1YFK5_9PEZI